MITATCSVHRYSSYISFEPSNIIFNELTTTLSNNINHSMLRANVFEIIEQLQVMKIKPS